MKPKVSNTAKVLMLGFLNELVQCIVFNFISVAINPFKILTIEKWDAT